MCGQYVQGVFRLVIMAQGVTVFVLNGIWAVCTKCSSFSNDSTRGCYFRIEWMCGQCTQGAPCLVMTAQGITIFVLNGCMGSVHKMFLV